MRYDVAGWRPPHRATEGGGGGERGGREGGRHCHSKELAFGSVPPRCGTRLESFRNRSGGLSHYVVVYLAQSSSRVHVPDRTGTGTGTDTGTGY